MNGIGEMFPSKQKHVTYTYFHMHTSNYSMYTFMFGMRREEGTFDEGIIDGGRMNL